MCRQSTSQCLQNSTVCQRCQFVKIITRDRRAVQKEIIIIFLNSSFCGSTGNAGGKKHCVAGSEKHGQQTRGVFLGRRGANLKKDTTKRFLTLYTLYITAGYILYKRINTQVIDLALKPRIDSHARCRVNGKKEKNNYSFRNRAAICFCFRREGGEYFADHGATRASLQRPLVIVHLIASGSRSRYW